MIFTIKMGNQSQNHGFVFENEIRTNVFNLPPIFNDINIHDIELEDETISIKSTSSSTIDMGSIQRVFNYKFDKKHTLLVVKYKQVNNEKHIENIYEFNFSKECHQMLFGGLNFDDIEDYNNLIKSMEKKSCKKQSKEFLEKKRNLQETSNCKIIINPKVDTSQKRVQCSIPKFEKTLYVYLENKSNTHNCVRGVLIADRIYSPSRTRYSKFDYTNNVTQEDIDNDIKYSTKLNKNLRIICLDRGIKISGKKIELVKRLIGYDLQKLSENFVKL